MDPKCSTSAASGASAANSALQVPRRASACDAAIPDRAVPAFDAAADPPLVEVTAEDVLEENCADARALLLEAVAPRKPNRGRRCAPPRAGAGCDQDPPRFAPKHRADLRSH